MNDTPRTYDVIVIGAGPVGENLADRTQAAGLSTVIVESELVGGECSYWACMPSKALLRPVLAQADARRLPGLSHAVQGPLDAAAVLARRDEFTSHWKDDGQAGWLQSVQVDLVRGHGRLDGPRQVAVTTPDGDTVHLTARHAVAVCTGTTAALPPMPGIHDVNPWISRDATSAKKVPGRLVVVGGGVVAVEMATAWQGLGSQVTLLVRGESLLGKMEPFVGEMVTDALRGAGVDVRFGAVVSVVERDGAHGEVRVSVEGGARVSADEVLFAIGREPHTGDIGLETVGLKPGGWLPVDDTCQVTGVDGGWLYAAGDVNHRALLTHQGKYQGRIAGAVIGARAKGEPVDDAPWGAHVATADHAAVPQVVFTDPEVAAVGLSAAEAEQAGRRTKVVDYDLAQVAGASLYGDDYHGRARMVVDLDRGLLLGVTFVGPGVGELLYSATVAVAGEVPVDRLWHAVPAYPTISEIWLRLLETFRG
ncbi:dihydrolipoyl dehydrogenase family protein [Streptomyces sp. NBC_01198]|uniref:dihydrolipoyl dehydrogenase family protein n=1 Tax=Streptomyces sp. NBC_01198 TaxID=2903769 RepID=UPI002E0F9A35|nr:NAD(P)/FAD-dependent oxidoreductase [Streptomyces sp. NBC_01198]